MLGTCWIFHCHVLLCLIAGEFNNFLATQFLGNLGGVDINLYEPSMRRVI